ncbi:hypothetical protein lerEdw1_021047 [Lerista edwardsae]|nr:hypothetical protein lerEdw1_021047 [Lerista edwardsae]
MGPPIAAGRGLARMGECTEPPEVTVTRKASHEGLETLLCRAHGFCPREIEATWRRDGEVRQGDTFRGTVSPNADGTYHTWLSIEVDPQERSRFRAGELGGEKGGQEPLDMAVEESGERGQGRECWGRRAKWWEAGALREEEAGEGQPQEIRQEAATTDLRLVEIKQTLLGSPQTPQGGPCPRAGGPARERLTLPHKGIVVLVLQPGMSAKWHLGR